MSGIFISNGEKNVGLLVKFECNHAGETRTIAEDLTIDKVDNVSILEDLNHNGFEDKYVITGYDNYRLHDSV
jgi:hypothetical protein